MKVLTFLEQSNCAFSWINKVVIENYNLINFNNHF